MRRNNWRYMNDDCVKEKRNDFECIEDRFDQFDNRFGFNNFGYDNDDDCSGHDDDDCECNDGYDNGLGLAEDDDCFE